MHYKLIMLLITSGFILSKVSVPKWQFPIFLRNKLFYFAFKNVKPFFWFDLKRLKKFN